MGGASATKCDVCDQLRSEGIDAVDYVVMPRAGGGWHEWGAALVRLLGRIGGNPTQALVIEQPTTTRRYVQILIGHRMAHAEASSNVYLDGDARLTSEHEVLLERIGWRRPGRDVDDPDELPANWSLPLVMGDWDALVEVLLATLAGVFGFAENAPVEVRTFQVDNPCRACMPEVFA